MIEAFFHGIGFGLILTIMIGPVFFGLLQTSINKGFKQGVLFALGVSLSDITFIFLTYFGISNLLDDPFIKNIVTIVGGIVTIIFGIYYLTKTKIKSVPLAELPKGKDKSNMVLKGFFLNFLNPSVLFFWVGTVSVFSINYINHPYQIKAFFCGIIATLFITDVLKSYIANKIKSYFTDFLLNFLNKFLGIVFVGAGVLILYKLL